MKFLNKKQTDLPRRRLNNDDSEVRAPSRLFIRNRTITGTTSDDLDSTESNHGLVSTRKHTHRLTVVRRKAVSVLVVVIIVVVFICILVSNFTASSIISTSDTAISRSINKSRYEKIIQDYMEANPMSRLSIFQDRTLLSEYVSNRLPEVLEVKNKGTFMGRTNFLFTMRQPVAGWQIDNRQYFVDNEGIPFEINYFPAPAVQISDNSGVKPQKGSSAVVSRRFLSFVGKVVYGASQNGYIITKAVLPVNTTRELDVNIKDKSYYIKLSIDRPAGEQVSDAVNAIRYLNGKFNPSYIDVRVAGKAFYK